MHATPLSVTLLFGLFHWNDFPAPRNWLHSHFSLFLFTQKDRLKSTRSTRRADSKFLNELVSKSLGVCFSFLTLGSLLLSFIKWQLQPSPARLLLIGSILFPETPTRGDVCGILMSRQAATKLRLTISQAEMLSAEADSTAQLLTLSNNNKSETIGYTRGLLKGAHIIHCELSISCVCVYKNWERELVLIKLC